MAAHAVAAAVKLICKDRQDSFRADLETIESFADTESFAWNDNRARDNQAFDEDLVFVDPPWLKNSELGRRPTSSRSGKKGTRSRDSQYADENRSFDANVDRHEAMKLATKPPLTAVAELSPRLSDMASMHFQRGNSMQLSPRSMSMSIGTIPTPCRINSFVPHDKPRKLVASPSMSHRSPRNGIKSHYPSPPGTPGVPPGTPGFPRPPSFAMGERVSAQPTGSTPGFPRPPSFAMSDRVPGPFDSGTPAFPSPPSFESFRPPLRAVAHSPSHRSPRGMAHSPSHHSGYGERPAAEPCVVYQPRGSSTPSVVPPELQSRQMSRTHSEMQPRQMGRMPIREVADAGTQRVHSHQPAVTAQAKSMPSLFWQNDDTELIRQKLGALVLPPGNELARNESSGVLDDSSSWQESMHKAFTARASGHQTPRKQHLEDHSQAGAASPRVTAYPLLLGDKIIRPTKMKNQSKKVATRSRSASVFWQPPPEAACLCENMRSPSFLLHARAEAAAAGGSRQGPIEATNVSRWGNEYLGSSSQKAVVTAVCNTMGSSAAKWSSPSMQHRDTRRSPVMDGRRVPPSSTFPPSLHHRDGFTDI